MFVEVVLWVAIAIPFLFVGIVLVAVLLACVSMRKTVAFAAQTRCPACKTSVGRDAVLTAKAANESRLKQMMKEHPGVRFRVVAEWEIRCPQCGRTFIFIPSDRTIQQKAVEGDARVAADQGHQAKGSSYQEDR